MVLDLITIVPIIVAIFLQRPYILFLSLTPALIIKGAFAALPAGLEEALLLFAVIFSISLKKIFNTDSTISLAIIVCIVLFSYGTLFTLMWGMTSGEFSRDGIVRGGAFIIREYVVTFLLLIFIVCCSYSFKLMRYAFLEEKII